MNDKVQLAVIGGGPAGLAAAIAAKKAGLQKIVVFERDERPGGILNQCIHNGFGLHTFKEELTGPEYAQRYIEEARRLDIPIMTGAMVIDLDENRNVTVVSANEGVHTIEAQAIVLAMGCRERPRGALNIPGYRPAGIYSAGTAQKLVNMDGLMPGKDVVILGSGDIGLIMARRMTLEGARVHAVVELMPYSGGLKRNIVQCLDDFGIPLKLLHTVVDIKGKDRVESVILAQVDENRKPVPGTEEEIVCDTLLLSCGLIPENELSNKAHIQMNKVTNGPVVNESFETSVPGIFACGNVLHVHDLVDFVSQEAAMAGKKAAEHVLGSLQEAKKEIGIQTKGLVRYTVPETIDPARMDETQIVRFRVAEPKKDVFIDVWIGNERRIHKKRAVVAPGEMEEVVLKKEWFDENVTDIVIESEEE